MANRDINIQASLGKTTASGPGPAELPDVQVERRQPIDVYGAARQLEGLRGLGGGGGGYSGGRGYNPNMINGGLIGGKASYIPQQPSYGGGGGFSQAPQTSSVPDRVPTYLAMSPGYGGFGGYRPATANEPGAVFAGYKDPRSLPDSVNVMPNPTNPNPGQSSTNFTQFQADSGAYVPGANSALTQLLALARR